MTSGGAPVANATVQLVARVRRRGARPKPTGRVAVTGADGRFRLRVPAGPSRTLRLAIRVG